MGCSKSKFNAQESVSLCKQRKHLIKQSVAARRNLASAHSSYTISLKNTGAAIVEYAHGEDAPLQELHFQRAPASAGPTIKASVDTLPPPPPLPPHKFQLSNLNRSTSMPHLSVPKSSDRKSSDPIEEEGPPVGPATSSSSSKPDPPPESEGNMLEFVFIDDNVNRPSLMEVEESPPSTTDQTSHAGDATNVSLSQAVNELDDHFLSASQSAQEVSKILEANQMHYHSNFTDDRGNVDHAAIVMRVITWNRSLLSEGHDGKDGRDTGESDTLATVLDKLLAWEKKLYEEVKESELMKVGYQRKVAMLNKQKKGGSNPDTIEKARAAVSHLQARYMIAAQSIDATISEIQRLRDSMLYPLLVALVQGMATMWETIHTHHMAQLKIVTGLRSLETWNAPNGTTNHHHDRTHQLREVINDWSSQFQNLMTCQKGYVEALNGWLEANLNSAFMKERSKHSSSNSIHDLLQSWHEHLEKLPAELSGNAISSFGAVVETILVQQKEELKQKEKCEETRKEYARKSRAFEEWLMKRMERRAAEGVGRDDGGGGTGHDDDDRVVERKAVVEALKKKVEDEEAAELKLCRQVREKSIGSLKTHLPELFHSMSDFALASSEMYKNLWAISQEKVEVEAHLSPL